MWITYASQNIPGSQSFDMEYFKTLEGAVQGYRNFCNEIMSDECTMTLYWCPNGPEGYEMREQAEQFRDVGCPFDYPDRIIERGPKGGVLVQNT